MAIEPEPDDIAWIPADARAEARARADVAIPLLQQAAGSALSSFLHQGFLQDKGLLLEALDRDRVWNTDPKIERRDGLVMQATQGSAHGRITAKVLLREACDLFAAARTALAGETPLLGGRTSWTFVVGPGGSKGLSIAIKLDGLFAWGQNMPVQPARLATRIEHLLGGQIALDARIDQGPSDALWAWHNCDEQVAAPSAETAWLKRLACLVPHAPFAPKRAAVGFGQPYRVLDKLDVEDRVHALRRKLCPEGDPLS